MTDDHAAQPSTGGMRHWLGFLASGTLAFVVDAGVLKLLTAGASWPVLHARVVSIALAMIAGWLAHRRFTFAIKTQPTLAEFAKYLGVAWSASALNYGIFAAILLLFPGTNTLIALVIAGLFAMVASYLGLRFAAFRTSGR